MTASSSRVWLITGASRGFGLEFARAALDAGDRVVATARRTDTLESLVADHGADRVLALPLDVTDRSAVLAAVEQAVGAFGRIDVAINNAGFGLEGAVEEVSEQEARDQIETNVFGALWVTQAVLPTMRAQGSGRIIQISSIGGLAAFPLLGLYHASKWALEGFSESLAAEVRPQGIRVTIVEPSGFRTDWAGDSMRHATPLPAYDAFAERRAALGGGMHGSQAGDPVLAAAAVLAAVDSDDPPLRLLLGNMAFDVANATYGQRMEEWAGYETVSRGADSATDA